jgi:hypothetical protein
MAKAPTILDKPVTFGPFPKGVNNVDRSLTMGPGELVSAFNLDIDRAGVMSRRPGYTLSAAAVGAHSLWGRDNDTALYVAGADLTLLQADAAGTLSHSVLRAGAFAAGFPVSYVLVNGAVYYSNGIITGLIRADDTSHPWGVEIPARAPTLTATAGGLPAGRYQVALQYIDDQGEFGGLTFPVAITVAANSAIVVGSIPAPVSADVLYVTVYVSEQNGEELYRYGDYPISTTSVTVNVSAQLGRRAANLVSDVMPPASFLDQYNGRIYGAAGNCIYYTNALQYGQCVQRRNFIPWDGEVVLLKAVDDGLYVGTDTEVLFLAGAGPESFSLKQALPCGAVRGTGITLEIGRKEKGGPTVGWMSERGFVKARAGGNVEVAEKERVSVGMYAIGAALYRELGDVRQIIATMRGGTRSAVVSTDYAEAEVRRNGNLI